MLLWSAHYSQTSVHFIQKKRLTSAIHEAASRKWFPHYELPQNCHFTRERNNSWCWRVQNVTHNSEECGPFAANNWSLLYNMNLLTSRYIRIVGAKNWRVILNYEILLNLKKKIILLILKWIILLILTLFIKIKQ